MLEMFFDSSGIVYTEFIPGATVNKHRYKQIPRRLRNSVRQMLQDNAPAHRHVQEELAKQQVTVCHTLHAHLISHHAISFSFPA
jgi:hypothetical protein